MSNQKMPGIQYDTSREDLADALRDNARLRALIKKHVEFHPGDHAETRGCRECGAYWKPSFLATFRHAADCPAFTPDGTVR